MIEKLKQHPFAAFFWGSFLFFSLATAGTEINKLDIRFAIMLQDMARHPFGLFPTVNGIPYADYFVPWFFLPYLTTFCGRFVTLWTMSLPSMLLGSFLVAMTYRIGEREGRGQGFSAALLLLSVFEVIFTICSFGMDLSVAALAVIFLDREQRDPGSLRTHLVFALSTALCILLRGSLGLIVFGASAAGYLLMTRRWKHVLSYGLTGGFTALATVGALIGAVFLTGGRELFDVLVDWQILKRVDGGDYFYYFLDGVVSYSPLSLCVILAMFVAGKGCVKAVPPGPWIGFFLLPLVILSAPGGKHLRYLMPLMPAMALTAAWGLHRISEQKMAKVSEYILKVLRFMPAVSMAALIVLALLLPKFAPACLVPWVHFAAALILFAVLFLRRASFRGYCGMILLATLWLLVIYCGAAVPLTGMYENSSLFVGEVERERTGRIYFMDLGPDHEDLKYILHMEPARRNEVFYLFSGSGKKKKSQYDAMYPVLSASETLPSLKPDDILIVKEKHFTDAEKRLRAAGRTVVRKQRGRLGHRFYFALFTEAVPPESGTISTKEGIPPT